MLLLDQAHTALCRLADEFRSRGEPRLPTERALAERLGTSRTTVRRALGMMESQGQIYRVKGRTGGAYLTGVPIREPHPESTRGFCSNRTVSRSLNTIKGIPEILREQGFRDGTTVLDSRLTHASTSAAESLGLAPGEQVVSLLRLRHADGETLSLEQMYLNSESCARILLTDMTSVYETLLALGVQIAMADESIELAFLSAAEARLLGQPELTPVLKVVRRGFDQYDRPIEYSVDLFRADRTRLNVRSRSQLSAERIID